MAEIMQRIVHCPKGHYYDANKYSSCPTCSNGGFTPTIDPFSQANSGNSAGQSMNNSIPGNFAGQSVNNSNPGSFSPTIAPEVVNRTNDRMSHTVYIDNSTPDGAPAPVVGWLVAVSGPCRGSDYRVHTGYNYIGREVGDICIHGDNTISAEKDTNITYVFQTKKFYIAHEQGRNVLLINDIPALGGATELHNYDRITIGSTQLVFVALCGEAFSWDDKGTL